MRDYLGKLLVHPKRSPNCLLALWFFFLLFLGTLLLYLPVAHRPDAPEVTFLTAFFTATSAFCVTGLVVVDTHDTFSIFGQVVILLLIEMGGVGIMTFASLAFSMIGRRLSLVGQAALTDTLFQNDAAREFRVIFANLFKAVIAIQAVGVMLLYLSLRGIGPGHWLDASALWTALFHSVSAFCNAGFSTYRDNLVSINDNSAFLIIIALLVILGGLGHGVLAEIFRLPRLLLRRERKTRWLSLNSRVSLLVTGGLLVVGAVLVAGTNYFFSAPDGENSRSVGLAVFHSIVSRTAGFNATDLGAIPLPTCLFLCLLMFIGGSPGSCAGGVKTTSLAIWIARIPSNLRRDPHVNILGYSIAQDLVSRARIIMALSTLWIVFGVIFLSMNQPPGTRLAALLFEQISAFGTVGLSMNCTGELTSLSRLWIIATMIMGKFGPLTVALWMTPTHGQMNITRPEGRLMIG